MHCARCGGEAELELHRYGTADEVVPEGVCRGCCTRIEAAIAGRFAVPDEQAFVLALTDAVDRLASAHRCRAA